MSISLIRTLVAATIGILLVSCPKPLNAGKGGKGGGGGSQTPAITIVQLDEAGGAVSDAYANDLNNTSDVVGRVDTGSGSAAAYWTVSESNGTFASSLTLLNGGETAVGINDFGEIVGTTKDASGNLIGLYWQSSTATPLMLPPLPGYSKTSASSISNDGIICGTVGITGETWEADRAVVWKVHFVQGSPVITLPVELPGPADGSSAADVNDNDDLGVCQTVGTWEATQTAVVWNVATLADGTLQVDPVAQTLDSNARATGINNSGDVCGTYQNEAVVWSAGSLTLLDRPSKGKHAVPSAAAWDISNSGIIAGDAGDDTNSRACYWVGSGASLSYLDSYLDGNSTLLGLSSTYAVNDSGDMIGVGWYGAFIAIAP